ncbi:SDR family oxidoreductase [Herbidospora daliensis]|uniref:SDR family oxidoreductase n=1 Tax=Herbidospora daliensis TaxID=295585 RepID=UPI0007814C7B|nr:SDR family oxidoreductase [Herbidospora daliensis]
MKILYIGGTGIISASCARLTLAQGHEVTLVNRARSTARPVPGARLVRCDVRDTAALRTALGGESFDVVVNFLGFTPDQVRRDVDLFTGATGQYVFVSSASAYQTPPARMPVTESTPLKNPYWAYSRAKIACEDVLMAAYRDDDFPVTIVRPSHTYDPTMTPFDGGWTVMDRMRRGAEVVVPGDGTSLWTLTHHSDFARGFVGLLGLPHTIGEAYHITSDEALTWNEIYEVMARAAGVRPRPVHVPSTAIAAADPEWGAALLGDKANTMIFDNAKLRRVVPGFAAAVPFARGAAEIVAWHDADPARRTVDPVLDQVMNRLVDRHRITGR